VSGTLRVLVDAAEQGTASVAPDAAHLLTDRAYPRTAMRRRTRAVAANLAALCAETATKFVNTHELVEVPVVSLRPAGYGARPSGRARFG
jgi:hypothetical protein